VHGLGQSYGQCGHDLRLTKVKNSAGVVAFTFSSGVHLMSFTLCVTMNWLLDATAHSKTMSSSGSRPAGAGGGGGAGARSQPAKLSLDHGPDAALAAPAAAVPGRGAGGEGGLVRGGLAVISDQLKQLKK